MSNRVPRTAAGCTMLVSLTSVTRPLPQDMIDLICDIEDQGAADSLDALRAAVEAMRDEAERRSNVHMAAKEWERSDRAGAQTAILSEVLRRIAALRRAEGSSKPPEPCARYFGSDETLCSTHHGRFASPSENRCSESGSSKPEAEKS